MTRSRHHAFRQGRSKVVRLGDLIVAAYDALGPGVPTDRVAWLLFSTLARHASPHRRVRIA